MVEAAPEHEDTLGALGRLGVVPVVKIDRAADALPLGEALIAGGLPCAEITFRTSAAEEAIRSLAVAFPELLLGAGTVLTLGQAERAASAGARFIVSPGFSPALVDWCRQNDMTVLPGVATPTEIMMAIDKGLSVMKFFPAESLGGVATLKALSAPFGHVTFIPTGGISARNLLDYLSLPAVHACGGSWMVETKLISGGQFDEIARLSAEARAIVRQVRGEG
jgi:2-dehydro-3-deoxyphosphogluconate aldolase / (4S)-4-hydroxy-2-oxoglutarate aldolase